jgi:hypothetical protein
MNLRDSWLHRLAKVFVPAPLRPSNVLTRAVVRRTGQVVVAGPFGGMKFVATCVGSVYCPKLLGVYERELHPVIEVVVRIRPDQVVNVGAAEGYYAVGFARILRATTVVAFEQTAEGQALIGEMAKLNSVADRVRVCGRCDLPDLTNALMPTSGRTVIICDVEGYEATLLDPAAVPGLAEAWVLVELHEFVMPGVGKLIRDRFAATHRIVEIPQGERSRADYPYLPWYTWLLPKAYATFPVSECRPARMSWLWMEPLVADLATGFR